MRVIVPALLASATLLLASVPAAVSAQEVVQALPGTTDADRLAEQMRALAANPRDLDALIAAADLSLALDDLSGAASLYARAEKVSARDPRIKAGEGAILVRSERPGEALRYFAQAEAAGYDVRRYAADRGLAYDLIGQQERAQRDYRLALKDRADDEVVKRYALSLGISGQREAALQQLDPLLRKQDRGAWRTRAFILAMNGDQAGAERIVTTMLPQGMAQGLVPFFQRLPALTATDRAFAVHFGEVRASPERMADARLAPVLPQLAAERPVALAAVQPQQRPSARDTRRRGRNARDVAPAVAVAAATPSYQAATAALARVQPVPQQRAPVALASAAATAQPLPTPAPAPAANAVPSVQPLPTRVATVAPTVQTLPTQTVQAQTVQAQAATQSLPTRVASAPVTPAATPTVATTPLASVPPVATAAAVVPAPQPALVPATPAVAAAAAPVVTVQPAPREAEVAAAAPAASFAAPPSRAEADSVLARIVAGLSIPAAELDVVEPVKAAPVAKGDAAARVLAEAQAKEERDAAAERALAVQAAADKRAADRKALADKKALAAKKIADDKAAAAKKEAAAKKLAEAKEAAEAKKLARANPERIWVQVAGGAYAGDLPKAYAAVKAKAPAAFGGRGAWTTPLRATNRVLIGPFKTDAEARAQVNTLAKAGVSAFTFTSDAGQPVTKLPAK